MPQLADAGAAPALAVFPQGGLALNRGIRWNSSGATSQWSADSKQLVYNNGDFFLGHEIYIINTNGSGNTNLTNSENVDDRWPDWSPIPLLLP
jgi:Tol biopolymer transport system component